MEIAKSKITLVIPALNEVESLPRLLKEIPQGIVDEVLVSDGHSTDGTRELVKSMGFRAVEQEGKGFGAGIKSGVKAASGDIFVLMDADGSQNPQDIARLLKKLEEGYDIGWGSRYLTKEGSKDDTIVRLIGNRFFTFLTNHLKRTKISDSLYFFFAMRKEDFLKLNLTANDFSICIELPIRARRAGLTIGEVPCLERARFASVSRVNALKDGIKILWQMLWW